MATLTIRNIDDQVKAKLRINAAEHGVSMEEEVRQTLTRGVMPSPNDADSRGLAPRIRDTMAQLNIKGFDFKIPPREPMRDPPDFSGWPDSNPTSARTSKKPKKAATAPAVQR